MKPLVNSLFTDTVYDKLFHPIDNQFHLEIKDNRKLVTPLWQKLWRLNLLNHELEKKYVQDETTT